MSIQAPKVPPSNGSTMRAQGIDPVEYIREKGLTLDINNRRKPKPY